MTDIVERLRRAEGLGLNDGRLMVEAADEIERLRAALLAPSISWDGFLVSGMQESIDEVCRLIALEKRGHV